MDKSEIVFFKLGSKTKIYGTLSQIFSKKYVPELNSIKTHKVKIQVDPEQVNRIRALAKNILDNKAKARKIK